MLLIHQLGVIRAPIPAHDHGVGGLRIMNDVGAKVHKLKGLKLHAKMMLVDDARAIIGSVNLAPGSFDSRRELAIETDHHHAVKRLEETAHADWEASHKIDLSDEGLLADLKKRDLDASQLALGEHGEENWLRLELRLMADVALQPIASRLVRSRGTVIQAIRP